MADATAGAGTANIAAAVDERIEHHTEELVGELEGRPFGSGRVLAGQRAQRVAGLAPVRPKTLTKLAGSAPPELKKLLSALATFCWF